MRLFIKLLLPILFILHSCSYVYETAIENNSDQEVTIEYEISLNGIDVRGYFQEEPMLYNSQSELVPFEDTNPLPNLIAGIIPPNHYLVISRSMNQNYELNDVNATPNFNFIQASVRWGENNVQIDTNNFNQFFLSENSSYQINIAYAIDNKLN